MVGVGGCGGWVVNGRLEDDEDIVVYFKHFLFLKNSIGQSRNAIYVLNINSF